MLWYKVVMDEKEKLASDKLNGVSDGRAENQFGQTLPDLQGVNVPENPSEPTVVTSGQGGEVAGYKTSHAAGTTGANTGSHAAGTTGGSTQPQLFYADLAPGTVLVGQYQIIDRLGSGGMGDVYRCEDLVLHRQVAVKLLGLDSRRDPQLFIRFQTEARAIARLEHRNIVNIYNMCMDEHGQPVMVMELVQGENLAEVIREGGPLPIDVAIDYTLQICSALSCAHQRGVIHRDLKPGNVMIVEAGTSEARIKLLDFGIAKLEYESLSATRSGEIFGSPSYMSPEQAKGEPIDARTDQYSLACMLFEMLTGRVPFLGKSAIDVLMGHIDRSAPPLSAICSTRFPQPLEEIIATMLAKDPGQRYATISDVSKSLADLLHDVRTGQLGLEKATSQGKSQAEATRFSANMGAGSVVSNQPTGLAANKGAESTAITGAGARLGNRSLNDAKSLPGSRQEIEPLAADQSWTSLAGASKKAWPHIIKARQKRAALLVCLVAILGISGLFVWKGARHSGPAHPGDEHDTGYPFSWMGSQPYKDLEHGEEHPKIRHISDEQLKALITRSAGSKILNLDNVPITDRQLLFLRDCPEITNLSLDGCRLITGAGLNALVKLPLVALGLANTAIRNEDLATVAKLPKLEFLNLSGTNIDDAGCRNLSPLHNLNRIVLNKTEITSETLRTLAKFKYLEEISLASDARILEDWGAIQMLYPRHLNLDLVGLKDEDLLSLAKINSLESVSLDNNEITDQGLLSLAQLPQLRTVSLRRSKLSLEGVKNFAQKTHDMCDVISDRKWQFPAGQFIPQGQNLLKNPGFEDLMKLELKLINRKSPDQIPHWDVPDGSVELVRSKWKAHDGEQSLALNALGAGAVRQIVDTTPDAIYQMELWTLADPRHPRPSKILLNAAGQQHVIDVHPAAQSSDRSAEQSAGPLDEQPAWKPAIWRFKAVSRKTTVYISSGTPGFGGPVVDSVMLRVVQPKGQ
jgi:serine/threonine protein kinase